jgi:hypothetical protein
VPQAASVAAPGTASASAAASRGIRGLTARSMHNGVARPASTL